VLGQQVEIGYNPSPFSAFITNALWLGELDFECRDKKAAKLSEIRFLRLAAE
jgi:hypothetical protein